MANKYSRIFAILKDINTTGAAITKEDVVSDFTGGKTTSLSSLNTFEVNELVKHLMVLQSQFKLPVNDHLDRARKAIISQFKSVGRTTEDAIVWAEKYGVYGQKKRFNEYNGQELWQLLQNAKKVKVDTIRSVLKKV